MSLITEALGLRRSKSAAVGVQETLPPFRTRNLGMQVIALMIMIAGLTIGAVWQGPAILHGLEKVAGMGEPVAVAKSTTIRPKEFVAIPDSGELPAARKELGAPLVSNPMAKKAEPVVAMALMGTDKEGEGTDRLFEPVEIPLTALSRDEDPAQAAEKKKNALAAVVRTLEIQGVRLQGEESRALINGIPIALGESVGDGGLRLKAVEPSRLIFADASGNEYLRSY